MPTFILKTLASFIRSAVKPMPLGLGYKAETIQAQPFRVGL